MKKRVIAKSVLFVSITIVLVVWYYKVLPVVNRYGLKPFYVREYIYTEEYEVEVLNKLIDFETAVNQAITLEEGYHSEYLDTFSTTNSNLEYILDITKTNGEKLIITNQTASEEDLRNRIASFKNGRAFYMCKLDSAPDTSVEKLKSYPFHANQQVFSKLDVYVRIRANLDKKDNLHTYKEQYEEVSKNVSFLAAISITLLAISLGILIYLSKKIILEKKSYFDSLYWEEIIVILITVYLTFIKITGLARYSNLVLLPNWVKWITYFSCYFIISELYYSIIDRIIKKDFKNKWLFPKLLDNIRKVYQPLIIYIIGNFIYYWIFFGNQDFIVFLSLNTVLLFTVFRYIIEMETITKDTKHIGKEEYVKIETNYPRYQELANNLNEIQEGIKKAVEEKMKSERLKTDLIANVSHDLKTPLTSIINYISLLKKENMQSEKAQKYINILESKSKKLKDLTEDLIDASKISSGNEKVDLESLNFAEMVLQANGEFAEKFDEKGLELVSHIETEEIYALLDSKKMWRVLENIYSNIAKYALENTRVYVRLERTEDNIMFSIKNISKDSLDIAPEELIERFVRGDKARATSGNGLGLSIAKDLVELQGGKFEIWIEGDLFKVSIKI